MGIAKTPQGKREVSDLEMMQHPEWWPLGFRLPLKRVVVGGDTEYGFLLDYHADEFWWFEGKMVFDQDVVVADAVVMERDDLKKLTDKGWVVD